VLGELTLSILWRITGNYQHHTLGLSGSDVRHWSFENNTVFDRTSGTEQLPCSNSGETFCAALAVSLTDSISLSGTVTQSILSQTNPVCLLLPKYLR